MQRPHFNGALPEADADGGGTGERGGQREENRHDIPRHKELTGADELDKSSEAHPMVGDVADEEAESRSGG